jgi:chromosome segregation ATPase
VSNPREWLREAMSIPSGSMVTITRATAHGVLDALATAEKDTTNLQEKLVAAEQRVAEVEREAEEKLATAERDYETAMANAAACNEDMRTHLAARLAAEQRAAELQAEYAKLTDACRGWATRATTAEGGLEEQTMGRQRAEAEVERLRAAFGRASEDALELSFATEPWTTVRARLKHFAGRLLDEMSGGRI